MTIDETIKRCIEAAAKNKTLASKIEPLIGTPFEKFQIECQERAAKYNQFAEWLMELKEAKRLLKAAVEDMYNSVNDVHCKYCSKWHTDQCQGTSHLDCCIENKFKWRYADEALKLIGGNENA